MSTKSFFLMLLLALSIASSGARAFNDRVLAIVNEDVITQSEFDYRINSILQELQVKSQPVPADLPKQLLDTMISDRVQVQEANRRGIKISDQDLAETMQRFASQQNATLEQLESQLKQDGQPFKMFKESVRDSMTISRFTDYYARSRVVVPDYEIDGFIVQNKLDQDNSEYHIAHILIKEPEENRQLADQVRAEIAEGLSFQQAVLTYSEATDAQQGGVIGWRTAEQLPQLYVDAIKSLQVGEVTPVLQSDNGLHILKLLELKGDRSEILQTDVSHILISAESKVAKKQAAKKLYKLRQRVIDGENFSDLARIFSDDSVSAANGGSLGWVSPGEMVPEFEEAFKKLPLNETSLPVSTQFGMHMILVNDRRKKNVTDQLIRSRADSILRRQRADREYQQWVRELMEGAYVEYVSEPKMPVS